MDEDKIKPKRIINKRNLLIFFVLFGVGYWLLHHAYREILHLVFSDLTKRLQGDARKFPLDRYHEFMRWKLYEPFILLITLSFTCVYTAIFKKNYFKASVIAFLIFIPTLIIYGYLSTLYNKKQEKEKQKIYTNLIVGKWKYRNRAVGNVIIVFNRDSTGYRFTDPVKAVQKFRYFIYRGLSVAIDIGSNRDELYWIDSLTTKTLSITAGPFTKIKDNVYSSKFARGSQ